MVGRQAWKRLGLKQEDLAIQQKIIFENQQFTIAGIFASPGNIMESEVWMNLNDMTALTQRNSISSITVRMDDAEFEDIDLFAKQRLDLQISAISEKDYYANIASFYQPIKLMAWLTAILIASGALFGGINTFYAAIENRSTELATLQAIGFQRTRLVLSLYTESLLIHVASFLTSIGCAVFSSPW